MRCLPALLLTLALSALCAVPFGAGCSLAFSRSSHSAYDPRLGDPDCDTCVGSNIKDKIGWTPLRHAEDNGNRETIEYLKKVSGGSE